MRNLFILLSLCFCALCAQAETFDIKQIRNGEWTAHSIEPFRSTSDGKHYTALTPDHRAIVKYQYSNGEAVDTLLNIDNVTPEKGLDVSPRSFSTRSFPKATDTPGRRSPSRRRGMPVRQGRSSFSRFSSATCSSLRSMNPGRFRCR